VPAPVWVALALVRERSYEFDAPGLISLLLILGAKTCTSSSAGQRVVPARSGWPLRRPVCVCRNVRHRALTPTWRRDPLVVWGPCY